MDVVPGEQYRYALANFRIAHEKVESQRTQLQEQERQIALLRQRIGRLEGADDSRSATATGGTSSVDDFSIKNAASALERQINRYAADTMRTPPNGVPLTQLRQAVITDMSASPDHVSAGPLPMVVQNLLRHAMSEAISESVINCFVVTNSAEANVQLTRIHENIFAKDPTVASVWRRQTFSAAIEACTRPIAHAVLQDAAPSLAALLMPDGPDFVPDEWMSIVDAAHSFSRMLHGARAGGEGDAFYRAFVPEMAGTMRPSEIELVKRCIRSERGEMDRVGATVFPGLVKVTIESGEELTSVVRRAQCICTCALNVSWTPSTPVQQRT
ncbi:hypothetical protein EXIGLDRAFT_720208 [Exidia glandulosa HHB12029]|uniref:Uncharacterized protein n=1 Tax=Exidia glandulosa HHB12029 TaxID=1314781 RepID=A0A165GJC0_EXIGL|nr:hypothetical protein EXIGLDRAFT_720208 [Exidia glandulosa HHB12029]